ncbi:hypothetical protein LMG33818_002015 [Halomonadaceae bacterium LMG 33818]|uniref:MetQ/NlpA family ABC transporter substrate-binding protein n=1 Tax=Cernens ardua TaxID=3402176 RepID=UPI003EDBA5F8
MFRVSLWSTRKSTVTFLPKHVMVKSTRGEDTEIGGRGYIPTVLVRRAIVALSLLAAPLMAWQAFASPLRLAINSDPTDSAIYAAVAVAKKEGLNVQVTELNDWVTPNTGLANGDFDFNYFEHRPFLANANQNLGLHLVPVGFGIEDKTCLYSSKHATASQIPDGARAAIADDPVNESRGLSLYQRAGLITLKKSTKGLASLQDIAANPRHLKFVEMQGPMLARAISDVDIAQSYPIYVKAAGTLDPSHYLVCSDDKTGKYALVFVSREDNRNDPRIQKFIHIYQTAPQVRAALDKVYGDASLYELAWQKYSLDASPSSSSGGHHE